MPYSYSEIARKLKKLGFEIMRQGKGSHVIFGKNTLRIVVPHHGGNDISPGVEQKIINATGLTKDDFKKI